MSLGLVVLEEKLFTRTQTRTPMPQSDDIMSADIKTDLVRILSFIDLSFCEASVFFADLSYENRNTQITTSVSGAGCI